MNLDAQRLSDTAGGITVFVTNIFVSTVLVIGLTASVAAQAPAAGVIRGMVLDTEGGAPVENVLVRLQDSGQTTMTDEAGRFEFSGVSPGNHELYVSAVDFILVKRSVAVTADSSAQVTIVLTEGVGTLEQSVTVTERADASRDRDAALVHHLNGMQLQQLRGLVTNDPFRAIQVLPGVATGDDLKSEFTVRGYPMDHMVFTFEGIAMPLLVHTVQRIVDTGSIAMINGDVLEEVSLIGGAYPQRYGDRLGAEIDFRMREGSRDRTQGRVSITGTDSALITEGPIGRQQRGSWLTSIRKSYFDLITGRIKNDTGLDFTFGFIDVQAKAAYDINPSNQLQFAMAAGRSRLNLDPEDIHLDDPQDARNVSALGVVTWRHLFSPRLVLIQRFAAGGNTYRNTNPNSVELASGTARDLVYRSELTAGVRPPLTIEAGGELRASALQRAERVVLSATRIEAREDFDRRALAPSAYVQARVTRSKWSFTPGVRVDHWTLTGESTASPWAQLILHPVPAFSVRGGASLARQRPTIDQLVGLRGTPGLETELALQRDIGIDGAVGSKWRWTLTGYQREERNGIRLARTEFQVINHVLIPPLFTTHFENALTGTARGLEATIERRAVNGLAGWISYAFGRSEYRDRVTGEDFSADYDQRHTINAYALYRFNEKFSTSGRFRSGSNFPTPGYWEARDGKYFVGTTRNDLRVRPYSRLDFRLNRTFAKRTTRLTVFAEVLNALNRRNVRAGMPGVNRSTFEARGLYGQLFPRVPSAGVLFEF